MPLSFLHRRAVQKKLGEKGFMKISLLLGICLFLVGCTTTNPPVIPAGSISASASAPMKLTPEPADDIQVNNSTIDKEEIRRAIRESRRDFQKCFNGALKRKPTTSGKIEIEWDFNDKGAVSSASVRQNLTGDDEFGQCVKKQIEKLRFPAAPNGQVAHVIFPFVFDRPGELAK